MSTIPPLHGRLHLRVPHDGEASFAWGYERVRCRVSEFSMNGLTVQGLAAPVGTPLCIELQLGLKGAFCLCGVVVHRRGSRGSAGVRFLEVSPAQRHELESYLWDLLAASSMPVDSRVCKVVGCDRPRKARGLCSLHYNRWRRRQAAGR